MKVETHWKINICSSRLLMITVKYYQQKKINHTKSNVLDVKYQPFPCGWPTAVDLGQSLTHALRLGDSMCHPEAFAKGALKWWHSYSPWRVKSLDHIASWYTPGVQLLLELVQRTQELHGTSVFCAGSLNEQHTMSSSHALPHELCIVYS